MAPRIALPMPHSSEHEYAERAIPQYERAIELAGGEPVRIPLDAAPATVARIVGGCDGVLLPGSKADIDPARFNGQPSPHSAVADHGRETIDDRLLEDAYKFRKPVLGICYGLQSLNVYRGGSLVQHIPDFLPQSLRTRVNHEAGKTVAVAHNAAIQRDSGLAGLLSSDGHGRPSSLAQTGSSAKQLVIPVNSSHHQSVEAIGRGLRIVASCPDDGIIEAIESTSPDHFVLAVQWHPERSVDQDEFSRLIFRGLVEAARDRAHESAER
ncbi:MAG TPA: gamma-glutamyl-gamma-aminobutyrate hydrolase family protein [Candidatus Aquilonibacter sp.]|nr:gamma-glutamyl-gamma-aminobutyrate hydrolase family protein [Candidatus Aquilonibacter sp.]